MLSFAVLSSGSKGNSILVRTACTTVLVDCGINYTQLKKRLQQFGIGPESLDAVIISHEHYDHVCGLPVLFKRHETQVFATRGTVRVSEQLGKVSRRRLSHIEPGEPFMLHDLTFSPFEISHDAAQPVGFRITAGRIALSIVTDLGEVTETVRTHVQGLDALVLESNHDPELLESSPYTWQLKARIAGNRGHLSNGAASALIRELSSANECRLKVLVAAHISENSNRPELAVQGFHEGWSGREGAVRPTILAGSPYVSSAEFTLGAEAGMEIAPVSLFSSNHSAREGSEWLPDQKIPP